ncbi:MAG TPA: IS4 family transposase [Planctomycetaceae bacterium]|nr:IS4 family transposase [Planctomycetaceae bacterium]
MAILASLSPRCFTIFQRSMIQSDDLPLSEILDSSLIADAFEEDKVDFGIADEDVFTPAITLWAMVSQFLFAKTGRSCKAAAGRVVSLWARTANRVVAQNAGNFCRAKAKIPTATVRKIALRLASEAEQQSLEFDDPHSPLNDLLAEDRVSPQVIAAIRSVPIGGRIIMVDGFTIDAPDTKENQAKYPQPPAQSDGLGFPMIRCVCLVSMLTGMLIDLGYAPYSGKGTGETAILRQLRSSLRKGDILVADSYYFNYWLIAMCLDIGVHVVMKNHHLRDDNPIGANRLSETERTVKWVRPLRPSWMPKKVCRKVPRLIEMRLSDIAADKIGSRSDGFTVATTLLDTQAYPGDWIGSVFEGRWIVEPDIGSVECTMGLEHLRGQSPETLEREIWTAMLTYNLVRLKMLQSGYAGASEIWGMSFTETYQLLSTNWLLCACTGVNEALVTSAQAQGICAVVGNRPDRSEPRENKRRPKVLKLMTVPRRIYHAMLAALSKIP